MAFTQAAKRLMLQALLDMVVEAGWGTSGTAQATGLTQPTYTQLIAKRLEGEQAIFEYALAYHGTGTRTLREIALFGRDPQGNRVMLYRRVREPVELEVGMTVIDRLTVRLEDL